ncbi:phage terminase large subunit [Enterococcus entomosocium]|uniref:phage terminase large subunit n=1 Tax=Enterococcus entomosocium TaxID=3034352 RepID=UPI002648EFEA|nr:phage terminase large subunit [Enterococcus entomosocium]
MTVEKHVEELKEKVRQIEEFKQKFFADLQALPESEQAQALVDNEELLEQMEREYRIARSEYDILYFTYEYFSDDRNPDNDDNLIPAEVSIEDAPKFHIDLCHKLEEQSLYKPTKNICWAAPRGHAKTMFNSNTYPIHELVFNKRQFILIISETANLSATLIRYIAEQLKYNEKLRADYGELLSPSKQLNDIDNNEMFETTSGALVRSGSIGKAIRGARNGGQRPDLIICDDLESMDNTNTNEAREKNLHWYNSVIVPIGTPEKTGIIYMGTMVHGSGLLPNILNRADYDSKVYSAFLDEPLHTELWQKYEEILLETENPNRIDIADRFYEKNKARMDIGAETLWQDRFSYAYLIKKKVEVGSRAFASEYLNKPSDPDSQIFNENTIHFFNDRDLDMDEVRNSGKYDIFSFWDIAIGRTKRSDYNAIVTIAKHRPTGIIYVIDAWAAKVPVHKAMEVAVEKIIEYKPRMFGVESVQAQYEMFRQLQQKIYAMGIYNTKILPVKPTGKKEERIELMEPLFENGFLKIRTTQRLLKEQLEQFPNADYDDLPDALASVINMTKNRVSRTYQHKPAGL